MPLVNGLKSYSIYTDVDRGVKSSSLKTCYRGIMICMTHHFYAVFAYTNFRATPVTSGLTRNGGLFETTSQTSQSQT